MLKVLFIFEDTIKERKYYFVTKDLGELKKAWEEAELGEYKL